MDIVTKETDGRPFYRIHPNHDGTGTVDVWLTPGTAVPRFDSLTGRMDYGFEILAVRGVEPYDGLEEDIRRRYTDWIKSAETIEI